MNFAICLDFVSLQLIFILFWFNFLSNVLLVPKCGREKNGIYRQCAGFAHCS